MPRIRLTSIAAAVALSLSAPLTAEARTPCANEEAAPTALNSAQVSDAIFCLTNQVRAHYGLPAFRRDVRLDATARLYSADMSARGFFGHTSPEGLSPSDRGIAQGYTMASARTSRRATPTHARSCSHGWRAHRTAATS